MKKALLGELVEIISRYDNDEDCNAAVGILATVAGCMITGADSELLEHIQPFTRQELAKCDSRIKAARN